MSSTEINRLIEVYEKSNCNVKREGMFPYPCALEINEVLSAIGAPEIAIDTSAPGENDGSELFIMNYYMVLFLSRRLSAAEEKIQILTGRISKLEKILEKRHE